MNAKQYRKKPVVIEALQLRWDTWKSMCEFVNVGLNEGQPVGCFVGPDGKPRNGHGEVDRLGLIIPTLEGDMLAVEGDWIIRGIKGEFYPCKPDIFEATYEEVTE